MKVGNQAGTTYWRPYQYRQFRLQLLSGDGNDSLSVGADIFVGTL
jgi:hypothetical protein